MNPLPELPGLLLLAEAPAGPAAGGLSAGTVLLALMVIAVVWLASSVSSLRNEVSALKDALTARPRPSPPVAPVAGGPTPAEIAAIAAAVHVMCGAGARVVAVVPPDASGGAWSRQGRREVFQSHQIR